MKNNGKVKPILISIVLLIAVIIIAIFFNTFSDKEVLQMDENSVISVKEGELSLIAV